MTEHPAVAVPAEYDYPPTGVTTKEQRSWFFYDWANSAYVTTTATVLFAPYMKAVATEAACPGIANADDCVNTVNFFGVAVTPGTVAPWTVTVSTLVSALVLIFVGAITDRTERPTKLLGGFAWAGSLAAMAMFFITGSNWQLGVALLIIANLCLGASLVVYDSLLNRIAGPDDRDRVSSRGWALGYAGGFILLALNFGLLSFYDKLGIDKSTAVRISMLSAGIWWAVFTYIPYCGLKHIKGANLPPREEKLGVIGGSLGQLSRTFRELRNYPQTMLFLVAYLFFNDGIQTVIGSSSLYGTEELKFAEGTVLGVFLFVQFVAYFVLYGLGAWTLVVVVAFFVPAKQLIMFLVLAIMIGIVLGGTQALSRSIYSQLIPRGKEAEFFSLYQAMERGTSWFGTFLFGLIYLKTGSYRPAIVALIIFFAIGGFLLSRVNMRQGIEQAGNEVPAVI